MAFHKLWKFDVVSGGGLTEYDVFDWLEHARIPLWFDFMFSPEECKWGIECDETYGCWPKPERDYTFTVVRPDNISNGIHMKNAAGLGWPKRFCITASVWDEPETLGLRLWHEALHSMGVDADRLNPNATPNDVAEFCEFVNIGIFADDDECAAFVKSPYNHPSNPVIRAYYYMLMVKRLGAPALSIPPAPEVRKTMWVFLIEWIRSIFKW